MKKADHKVYEIGSIHIPEGFYSEQQVREFLEKFKARDKALKHSMEPVQTPK